MSIRKLLGLVVAATVLLAGCMPTSNNVLNPAGYSASQEASLFWLVIIMALVVFVGVEAALIAFIIRYRRRGQEPGEPRQIHDIPLLEFIWTAIPVLIVIVIFVFMLNTMNAVAVPQPSSSDLKVTVVGHQWWWEFDYPDLGIKTANELHIPAGKNVQIDLRSVDVIHSFWVPQLSGKTDVIPGQANSTWLRSDQTGVYQGQCAEFCGTQHANMRFKVFVDSSTDFEAWVKNQQAAIVPPTDPLALQGEKIVTTGICIGCHTVNGTNAKGTVGPNLTHLFSRTTFGGGVADLNDQNLTVWLKNSGELKPGNDMQNVHVTDQQLPAILAYLHTLK